MSKKKGKYEKAAAPLPLWRRILFWVVLVILLGVFIYSAWSLGSYLYESHTSKELYNDLSDIANQNRPTRPAIVETEPTAPVAPPPEIEPGQTEPTEPPTEPVDIGDLITITDPKTGKDMLILPEYAELYQMNTDMVGWMQIPGSKVDYPVMQTPERKDYYLNRDFNKKNSGHGCLYAREDCDINAPSDNITIYGHRMTDGSMFAGLVNYKSKVYWQDHQYIYFDTLTERHTYQIITVFRTTSTINEGFRYNVFVDAKSEAEFDEFVKTCKELSYFDSGVSAQYGDKLICLSTCEYSQANGRLVVVAKRID